MISKFLDAGFFVRNRGSEQLHYLGGLCHCKDDAMHNNLMWFYDDMNDGASDDEQGIKGDINMRDIFM